MNPLSIECDVHFNRYGRGRKELEAGAAPPPPAAGPRAAGGPPAGPGAPPGAAGAYGRGQGLCGAGPAGSRDAGADQPGHGPAAPGPGHPGADPVPAPHRARPRPGHPARPAADRRDGGLGEAAAAVGDAAGGESLAVRHRPFPRLLADVRPCGRAAVRVEFQKEAAGNRGQGPTPCVSHRRRPDFNPERDPMFTKTSPSPGGRLGLRCRRADLPPGRVPVGRPEAALEELALVFEDDDWPPGEARFRRVRLIDRLRERGVTRACAEALIDELVARGVFRAGESFLDLTVVVRLDGRQSDTVRPDGYLHTTRERWHAFLADAGRARPLRPAPPAAAGEASAAPASRPAAADDRPFILTEPQERVLEALLGKAMTADALAQKLGVDLRSLFRDAIKELKARADRQPPPRRRLLPPRRPAAQVRRLPGEIDRLHGSADNALTRRRRFVTVWAPVPSKNACVAVVRPAERRHELPRTNPSPRPRRVPAGPAPGSAPVGPRPRAGAAAPRPRSPHVTPGVRPRPARPSATRGSAGGLVGERVAGRATPRRGGRTGRGRPWRSGPARPSSASLEDGAVKGGGGRLAPRGGPVSLNRHRADHLRQVIGRPASPRTLAAASNGAGLLLARLGGRLPLSLRFGGLPASPRGGRFQLEQVRSRGLRLRRGARIRGRGRRLRRGPAGPPGPRGWGRLRRRSGAAAAASAPGRRPPRWSAPGAGGLGLFRSPARISIGRPASESRRQVTCSPSSHLIFTETPLAQTMRPSTPSSVQRTRPPILQRLQAGGGRPSGSSCLPHDAFPFVAGGSFRRRGRRGARRRQDSYLGRAKGHQANSERNLAFFSPATPPGPPRPARSDAADGRRLAACARQAADRGITNVREGGATAMHVEMRPIESIRPYENNPRVNDAAVDARRRVHPRVRLPPADRRG